MSNEARSQAWQAGAANANDSAVPRNSSGLNHPRSWDNATTSEASPPAYTPTRGTGTIYTGEEDATTKLLMHNGINPGNLSDGQFATFKNQNPAVQLMLIKLYLQNLAKNRRDTEKDLLVNHNLTRSDAGTYKQPHQPSQTDFVELPKSAFSIMMNWWNARMGLSLKINKNHSDERDQVDRIEPPYPH